jgi:hypothetical protein
MEFTVKALDSVEPKSIQQIEAQLIQKKEDNDAGIIPEVIDPITQQLELKEEDVLSYIGKRYNKEIKSFDELLAERKESEPLPEDVAAYFNFKKETGRGIEDFVRLRKDFDTMNQDEMLMEYFSATEKGLDKDDIQTMMEQYSYDEDIDDDSVIKKAKLEKKKIVAKAKLFFNEQKEKYKQPLESSVVGRSSEDEEDFKAYKQYIKEANTDLESANRKRDWFLKKTDEVFSTEFKGFEFNIDSKKITYTPADATELKKNQITPTNFINKFLDENGLMKDAVGYHRALSVAMHPERFAKFFYEQGVAEATEGTMKSIKNIKMSEHRSPEITNKGGMQVKAVNPDAGRGLRISSAKKK